MAHTVLTAEELMSLRKLTHGAAAEPIDAAHMCKMLELGYALRSTEGVLITRLGCAVLAASCPDWPAPPPG